MSIRSSLPIPHFLATPGTRSPRILLPDDVGLLQGPGVPSQGQAALLAFTPLCPEAVLFLNVGGQSLDMWTEVFTRVQDGAGMGEKGPGALPETSSWDCRVPQNSQEPKHFYLNLPSLSAGWEGIFVNVNGRTYF